MTRIPSTLRTKTTLIVLSISLQPCRVCLNVTGILSREYLRRKADLRLLVPFLSVNRQEGFYHADSQKAPQHIHGQCFARTADSHPHRCRRTALLKFECQIGCANRISHLPEHRDCSGWRLQG